MEIVTKVMEKSWKFVGKNVYEPCGLESRWWRFNTNHRTGFTEEMRMTIACNITRSPTCHIIAACCEMQKMLIKWVLPKQNK